MSNEEIGTPTGRLLKVVEVDPQHKVRCRADGCGRGVYKRIHVVEVAGQITVLGSDCSERLYGLSERGEEALYGGDAGGTGRLLTDEERELMEANTDAFIDLMRTEYEQVLDAQADALEAELAAKRIRLQGEQQGADLLGAAIERERLAREEQERKEQEKEALQRAIEEFDPRKRAIIESAVRDELVGKYSINVNMPGWRGWYRSIVRDRIIEALGKAPPKTTGQGNGGGEARGPGPLSAREVEDGRDESESRAPRQGSGSSYVEDDEEEGGQESLW